MVVPSLDQTDENGNGIIFTLTWIHPDYNAQFCHLYHETPGDLPNFYLKKEKVGAADEQIDIESLDDLTSWLEDKKTLDAKSEFRHSPPVCSFRKKGETMDPQKAWDDLGTAVSEERWMDAAEIAEGILKWIPKEGYPPTITGKVAFDRFITRSVAQRCTSSRGVRGRTATRIASRVGSATSSWPLRSLRAWRPRGG